jgi:hypothetical protein
MVKSKNTGGSNSRCRSHAAEVKTNTEQETFKRFHVSLTTVLTMKPNSTEQSPSCEATSSAASQRNPYILRNPKMYCRVRNSMSLDPTFSHFNPVQSLTFYLFQD